MTDLPAKAILKCLAARPMASLRLVCFPHAGAGASVYQAWPALQSDAVEVFALQLPGREERLAETPFTDWGPMMDSVAAALDTLPKTPMAFFGHSLGAIIALEAARHIATRSEDLVRHLFVSGRPWPGEPAEPVTDIQSLSDDEFLTLMTHRYGSQGAGMENEEIRTLTLPVLRADVSLLQSYQWQAATPLPCSITVFRGLDDPGTEGKDLLLWANESHHLSGLSQIDINGDHLFHISAKEAVTSVITKRLNL